MQIVSSYKCNECYRQHPIEFRVRSDGSVEIDDTPLLDEIYPCLARFKREMRKIDLIALRPSLRIQTILEVADAIVRCLRPETLGSRIAIEETKDYETLGNLIRKINPSRLLLPTQRNTGMAPEEEAQAIVERIKSMKLTHPHFIKPLVHVLAKSTNAPEYGALPYLLLRKLMREKETSKEAKEQFQKEFKGIVIERYQRPHESIPVDLIHLWGDEILPSDPEALAWTFEALATLNKIQQQNPDAKINCYLALQEKVVGKHQVLQIKSHFNPHHPED